MNAKAPRLIVLSLLGTCALAVSATTENFVRNGNFEADANRDGLPDFWFIHPSNQKAVEGGTWGWIVNTDGSFLRVGKTGGSKAYIVSSILPDPVIARLATAPDRTWVMSARIRAQGVESPGANIGVLVFARKPDATAGHFVASIPARPNVVGSGDWTRVEIRMRLSDILPAGEVLHRVEFTLNVSSNTGYADFDDVSLTVSE